ncbi:NADH-quinone oxidoreductase subunit L [Actinomadura gamaensis]|uniref:NADH-quinone oxidoreductase subunit L n=1 Tax=Actinomadura gamaensis TaxID=1763541 RepID=A0ABV9TVN7_9ACTN
MSAFAWALPVLPVAAGALLLLAGRRADRIAPAAGIVVALGAFGLAVAAAVARPDVTFPLFTGLPAGLAVDGLSAVLVLTVASAALAVLVFAAGDIGPDEPRARFFGLMLVFAGAMLVTVTASDLAVLLMAWEVMGAMSYALIGFWWHDPERVESANVAFLTTRAGDLGLYFAAGCAVAGTRSLSLGALATASSPWRDLVAAGIVLAALGKSAQLPFSFWLSRAMAGPSPVSALLHSATMVAAGAYLLIRVRPLLEATGWAATLVAWVGALTALAMGAVAVAQRDLKQLLAASTCAQIGFMVLAAGAGSVAGGTAQLVTHAAVKCLLFLGAGAWLTALGTKDLAELRGAARRFRIVGVPFGAGALALAGFPPLSLWVTKDIVLASAPTPLYAVGLAAGVLAAAYSVKALVAVWRPEDALTSDDTKRRGTRQVRFAEWLPMPVLAVVGAGFGIVALPGVFGPWRRLLGASGEHGPSATELVVSGALAVLVAIVAIVAAREVPMPKAAANWLYLGWAADRLVARPVLGLANALARFDDRVLDGAVRAVASGGRAAATVASRRLEFPADGLVDGAGRAVRRLGALARRPQTGQVHAYYAQAAVLLVVLTVVVVLVG